MVRVKAKLDYEHYILSGKEYDVLEYWEDGCWVFDSTGERFCLYKGEYEVIEE